MGRYINSLDPNSRDWELPAVGKVKELLKVPGAFVIDYGYVVEFTRETFPKDVVCVIDNGHMEAALYCDTFDEFRRTFYRIADQRPRTWLIVPGADKLAKP